MSQVMMLAPHEEARWREFWEDMGYKVVISQQIPKGGNAEDIKQRLNERLKR